MAFTQKKNDQNDWVGQLQKNLPLAAAGSLVLVNAQTKGLKYCRTGTGITMLLMNEPNIVKSSNDWVT